jgi:hypothetical protein
MRGFIVRTATLISIELQICQLGIVELIHVSVNPIAFRLGLYESRIMRHQEELPPRSACSNAMGGPAQKP